MDPDSLIFLKTLAAWATLGIAMPAVLYLTVLAFTACFPARNIPRDDRRKRRFAVVIPAHNESLLIAGTIKGALELNYPKDSFQIVVIADNCSDDTAQIARARGVRVVERATDPGKGQALQAVFTLLLEEDWDGFLVMDADTEIHPDSLQHLNDAMAQGARALQLYYGVLNPAESMRTAVMELAFASINGLRPRGRRALGFSAGIFGNGFCLAREVLTRVPYDAHSIVEDVEYHLRLLEGGYKVRFLDRVWVKAQMPATAKDAKSQRIRWERGRLGLIRSLLPRLMKRLFSGRLSALEALLDLLVPPVTQLVLLLLVPLALGPNPFRLAALAGVFLLGCHYALAALRYGSPRRMCRIALYVPWYMVWKFFILAGSLFRHKHLPWVRTKRH